MSTTDLPGSSLLAGRYRLVERLGAGGMSVVWRGFDEVLGRQVAVKVLPPSTSADPSFRRRLRAEAQAAARLSHPHITNVYDYGEAITVDGEAVPYVVMELVDGESLAAVLARVRRLPWPAAVRICSEVSAALAAAHARGIVHRDVTPANVMLTPAGVKVVDFGISALIGENDIDPDGSLLGTPAYLAPERLEGGQVSPATDVYAVGLLIYRTLIGQLPWDVGTTTALLRAHQYTEPEPMPPVEGLPSAVSALIARCLEKRPSDRPSSAEMAHVLGTVSAGVPAARAFVPDWADNGGDTTILPSTHSNTAGMGRVRPGHARVADSVQARAGRGVAAVPGDAVPRAGASGAGTPGAGVPGAGAPGYPGARAGRDAPVSPAPSGTPVPPVSVAEVEAAFGPVAGAKPAAAPPQRGGVRNSRFGPVPPPASVAGATAAPSLPAGPVVPAGPGLAGSGSAGSGSAGPRSAGPASAGSGSAGSGSAGPRSAGSGSGGSGSAGAGHALRPAFGAGGPDQAPARGDDMGAHSAGDGAPPNQGRPGAHSTGAPGPGRRSTQRNRLFVVAGSVAASGLVAFAIITAGGDRPKDTLEGGAGPQPTTLAGSNKCVVSYAVWSEENNRFKAAVTIANRDTTAIKDWKLWFVMPGDQIVSGNGKLRLDQQGRGVTVQSKSVLRPQATETLQFTGRYQASNAAPMVFELGGQTCQTYVSPAPGAPSQPVEHLTNGTTRLGPAPTESSPIPGISIDPSGVAVPVPVQTTDPPATDTATPAIDPSTTATPAASTTTTTPPPPSPPPSPTPSSEPTTTAASPDPTTPPTFPSEEPDPADMDPPSLTG